MHSKQHSDCKCTILEAIPPEKQYLSFLSLALLGAGSAPVLALADTGKVVGWRREKLALPQG